jgi:hypothetical protein
VHGGEADEGGLTLLEGFDHAVQARDLGHEALLVIVGCGGRLVGMKPCTASAARAECNKGPDW